MSRAARELEAKNLVRARRVDVPKAIVVESRTIGAPLSYKLETENLSRSGLLLHVGTNRKVPYRVNTTLELTVDREGQVFDRPVTCLGKIVRVAHDEEMRPRFGVQIVQIEGQDLTSWEKGVTALEQMTAFDQLEQLPAA